MVNIWTVPTIHISKEDNLFGLPIRFIWKGQKWIKHVDCSGSRFHVLSYLFKNGGIVVACSEKNCIINAPDRVQIEASKLSGVYNNTEGTED